MKCLTLEFDLQHSSSPTSSPLTHHPFSSPPTSIQHPPCTPAPGTFTASTPTVVPSPSPSTSITASVEEPPALSTSWKGFKLVGDNVDKNVRASYQRIGHSTQSLHYFHAYAALDRVDFSGLSDEPPPPSIVDPLSFLPSEDDISMVERDMCTLISRYCYLKSLK